LAAFNQHKSFILTFLSKFPSRLTCLKEACLKQTICSFQQLVLVVGAQKYQAENEDRIKRE